MLAMLEAGLAYVRPYLELGANAFVVLYAAYGLQEVARRLPRAFARIHRPSAPFRLRRFLRHCGEALIATGPLFIAFEAVLRMSAAH
jgi:hypothetical protein